MTEYTPLPWRTAQFAERMAFDTSHITGANGRPVATTIYPLGRSDWLAEDEANARFIVLAVNSFNALLAALELLLDQEQSLAGECGWCFQSPFGHCERAACPGRIARAAIILTKKGKAQT